MKCAAQLTLFVCFTIILAACNKTGSSKSNPDNYVIIDGVKHQFNLTIFEVRTDSTFYFEMDSTEADHSAAILINYGSNTKMDVGLYPSCLIGFADKLLTNGSGLATTHGGAGALTITDISSGKVSGYFSGSVQYEFPLPDTAQHTLNFSGVFNNDQLTSQ